MMAAPHPEKLDHTIGRACTYLFVFIAGWLACGTYYGTLELSRKERVLEHIQRVELPKLKEAAECEGKRADRVTDVAVQAIIATQADSVKAPTGKDIPGDNCPHPVPTK